MRRRGSWVDGERGRVDEQHFRTVEGEWVMGKGW